MELSIFNGEEWRAPQKEKAVLSRMWDREALIVATSRSGC